MGISLVINTHRSSPERLDAAITLSGGGTAVASDALPIPFTASASTQTLDSPMQQREAGTALLQYLHPKSSRQARLRNLNKWCRKNRKQERMNQLLVARRREFEQRPCKERRELQEAFEKHDKNFSGSLDQRELIYCLADFGLKWKTPVEQKEFTKICNEVAVLGDVDFFNFCFELVPRVRQKLRELRHGELLEEFRAYDKNNSGYLDEHECKAVFEKLCTANMDPPGLIEMKQVFVDTIKELWNTKKLIDFEAFQEMVARAREHQERIVGLHVTKIYQRKNN